MVSGFLITLSYERCHSLWSFYVRRVFRLYPMYLCVVLIQTAIMLALLPDGPFSEVPSTVRYLATNMLLANFLQYDIGGVLSGLRNPGINPSLWTLKIEIGFYLIVPLIYAATRRWGWMVLARDLRCLDYLQLRDAASGRCPPRQAITRPIAVLHCRYGALLCMASGCTSILCSARQSPSAFLRRGA